MRGLREGLEGDWREDSNEEGEFIGEYSMECLLSQ
jgi:hypothetical protein